MNSSTITGRIRWVFAIAAVLGLGACWMPPAKPPPPPPPASPPPPPAPTIDYRRLNALLDAGLYALDDDRLTTPLDDCAYDHFRAALVLVPDEPRALAGLERVIERYLELAERAIAREQWATARTMIGRASIVNPDHAGIAQLNARIDLLRRASRERIVLDGERLTARDESIRAELVALGQRVKRVDVQVTIVARNDEEGRWIYRQLRDAPGEVRMQVQIQLGSAPAIDLLTLPAAGGNAP